MEELITLLNECLDTELIRIVISNPRENEGPAKIIVRPILLKEELWFQETIYVGTKVLHKNYKAEYILEEIVNNITKNFKQLQLDHNLLSATVLVSKKGKLTINKKQNAITELKKPLNLAHNRTKRYVLPEGVRVDFLVDLGVMTQEGTIVKAKYDKFKQINRFLEFIEDILPKLKKDKEVKIIDFGCGKSYLTFAMYYYLKVLNGFDVRIVGLDLKEDVIDNCNKLSEKYGFEKLRFYKGDIAGYEGLDSVDMVVTLHACDTATDYALEKAVSWGADVILSVPCCQHELNKQIKSDILGPVLKHGLIKERIAALVTDALRAELLESKGYKVQILEFIDMEHTPKNILIRAVKDEKIINDLDKYYTCKEFLGVNPTLDKLLKQRQEKTYEKDHN
ncbi:class I SAM-dependent methyltransferase [Candidatus Galacturonibacter soehngenii]|uniref:SAM-dependent methyltransferase n=1 Tax=Candidatus Galacturonatibacter soehngenii TaxID=2307010 RepID=A0A7V7QL24_9FIRM|nr:SAM-dependent methyltransferase [Candidatus Galacturonibacter soehngenii]KAB1438578.1 SAM-dependent methyltransferase [Candidatus Galacturonibacter soehngenii]MBA4685608.1 SAM-dependent methyltransferase [Candidatus Galacturonibacter soehngenii]